MLNVWSCWDGFMGNLHLLRSRARTLRHVRVRSAGSASRIPQRSSHEVLGRTGCPATWYRFCHRQPIERFRNRTNTLLQGYAPQLWEPDPSRQARLSGEPMPSGYMSGQLGSLVVAGAGYVGAGRSFAHHVATRIIKRDFSERERRVHRGATHGVEDKLVRRTRWR